MLLEVPWSRLSEIPTSWASLPIRTSQYIGLCLYCKLGICRWHSRPLSIYTVALSSLVSHSCSEPCLAPGKCCSLFFLTLPSPSKLSYGTRLVGSKENMRFIATVGNVSSTLGSYRSLFSLSQSDQLDFCSIKPYLGEDDFQIYVYWLYYNSIRNIWIDSLFTILFLPESHQPLRFVHFWQWYGQSYTDLVSGDLCCLPRSPLSHQSPVRSIFNPYYLSFSSFHFHPHLWFSYLYSKDSLLIGFHASYFQFNSFPTWKQIIEVSEIWSPRFYHLGLICSTRLNFLRAWIFTFL